MSTIHINDNYYSGNSVVVSGNKVIIDGKDVTPDSKEIIISVVGNISELKVDVCNKLQIRGDVGNIKTQSGDVDVTGHVTGSIQTMSGDVNCNYVGGSISTMSGNIKHKK